MLNPTTGSGWQYQISPGDYFVAYTGAGTSISNGLPWSAVDWTPPPGTNNNNTADTWYIHVDVATTSQGIITATTYALADDGSGGDVFITRSWRKVMNRVAGTDVWVDQAAGYLNTSESGWEELTPYSESPDGTLYRVGVANGGTFTATQVDCANTPTP